MVKFKITYRIPTIPVTLKKLVELKAKTPEEAWDEIRNQIGPNQKHHYLLNNIKNLAGIEQQEL
ncbi:MAG: hypothetical protein AABX02_00280 [archaeon]